MSTQLLLALPGANQSEFRWSWRDAQGYSQHTARGDHTQLQSAIAAQKQTMAQTTIETWLILPGEKLVTRELDYSEKEKKHLRNLLPFQLEESLIGDVDDIHLAIAGPREGKISIAYTDKHWLKEQIEFLKNLGLDIIRCSALPLLWHPKTENAEWLIAEYDQQIHVQYGPDLGFSAPLAQMQLALQLLLVERKPDSIILRASSADALENLEKLIPDALKELPRKTEIKEWNLDLSLNTLDFCQGEFSRRLPIERWWKIWQNLIMFAGVCVLISLVALMIQIRQLNKENLQIRAATEAAARSVIPQGKLTKVEAQVANLLSQLQPSHQAAGLMELLSVSLPVVNQSADVKIKALNYTQETGELAISLQAKDFAVFEQMTNALKERGLQAEILNVNAQGDSQTARLRIHK
jgi:general secretion pathway protein L